VSAGLQSTNLTLTDQRTLFDAMPHHVWTTPGDSEMIDYFNQRWYEYSGVSPAEALADSGVSTVHPDDLKQMFEVSSRGRALRVALEVEVRLRRFDGAYRWFIVRGAPAIAADGRVLGWVGTNTDIDDRKRAEAAADRANRNTVRLQAITARLSSALTSCQVVEVILEHAIPTVEAQAGGVILLNAQQGTLERIKYVGYAPELLEKNDQDLEHARNPYTDVINSGRAIVLHSRNEMRLKYPRLAHILDLVDLKASAFLPLIVKQDVIGVLSLGFAQDLEPGTEPFELMMTLAQLCAQALERAQLYEAEHRQAEVLEQRVQERTRELQHRNEELDAFASTVSHDLHAPLAVIAGASALLEQTTTERTQDDRLLLTRITASAHRMNRLISDLLSVARAGRSTDVPQAIDLGAIVHQVLEELEGFAEQPRTQMTLPSTWPTVLCKPTELYQVALNLIGNAIKFSKDCTPPQIELSCETVAGQVTLRVSDNGPGILEAQRARVFELFRKLDPNREGSGVGLAIVKRIAERCGGQVWIEDSPLGGVTFAFSMPTSTDLLEQDAPEHDDSRGLASSLEV
jgi:PAS domain S-box-containing protein